MKSKKGNMVNRKFLLTICMALAVLVTNAQGKYFTKNGKISFISKGQIEIIEAQHKSVTCVMDTKTGDIQFAVLMKGFQFEKARMQEHFNENYVESSKYPRSEFKGKIVNNSSISYSTNGTYKATVKGKLTLHGVTHDVETGGDVIVQDGKINTVADFSILLSDYKISIPGVVKRNINNTVQISVNCLMQPL